MAKSKQPKKSPSPTDGEEKVTSYKEMTLEQLESLTENSINNEDIEIDEDMAFNSDDEKMYGRYFSRSSSNNVQRNVSLCVPLQHNTKRIIEVNYGSKLLLSSICLDVTKVDYEQVKLMYKCTYLNQTNDVGNDYVCLGNYISIKNGGIGLQPSTSMNIQVMGPCKVEFKVEANPSKYAGGGSINIFGVVVPNTMAGYALGDDEDDGLKYADAFMSEEEEEEEESFSLTSESNNDDSEDDDIDNKANGKHSSKKRKLTNENAETPAMKSPVIDEPTHAATAKNAQEQNSEKKLTKKQRKKLAKEKAKQLEQTLSDARDEATTGNAINDNANKSEEPKKKKKKKQSAEVNEAKWSGTRERRLPGGLLISDLVLGAGAPVKAGKRISLHYTGKLLATGQIFDKNNSKQHPLVFRQGTGEVIRGLERGLEGMKSGGERVITIPSKLGYGSKGSGADIPPDSDLVFEVKVVKVG